MGKTEKILPIFIGIALGILITMAFTPVSLSANIDFYFPSENKEVQATIKQSEYDKLIEFQQEAGKKEIGFCAFGNHFANKDDERIEILEVNQLKVGEETHVSFSCLEQNNYLFLGRGHSHPEWLGIKSLKLSVPQDYLDWRTDFQFLLSGEKLVGYRKDKPVNPIKIEVVE